MNNWSGLHHIFNKSSPFSNETGKLGIGEYSPGPELFSSITSTKILVVGAGGLGCEMLKNLALSGFLDIHVIDLDNIDVSNLNRQFLFRQCDVGRSKAEAAAEFIMKRVHGCSVAPYKARIQDFDETFYRQFKVIISGLDNIEARRWLNSLLISMVEYDEDGDPDPSTIIPFVDGGTEGFKGQCRVIIPKITSCFECSIESFPPQQNFPLCTIAETPRNAEHCIAYAFIILFPKHFPDKKLDKDSPDDMQWVYDQALHRASLYGIEGVTYFKTIGVVKNIIPAVASTNAIISAACVNEVTKLLSFARQTCNNYYMYLGSQGAYSHTFEYGLNSECIVCSASATAVQHMSAPSSMLLADFINDLKTKPSLQLSRPSLTTSYSSLYIQAPPHLEKSLRPNLTQPLGSLIRNNDVVTITDPMLCTVNLSVQVTFNDILEE